MCSTIAMQKHHAAYARARGVTCGSRKTDFLIRTLQLTAKGSKVEDREESLITEGEDLIHQHSEEGGCSCTYLTDQNAVNRAVPGYFCARRLNPRLCRLFYSKPHPQRLHLKTAGFDFGCKSALQKVSTMDSLCFNLPI